VPKRWVTVFFLCSIFFQSILHAGVFVTPIGGTPYQDWSIVNYVDLDPTSDIRDYYGGNYTYDGHDGIDFTLANFAEMDRGVAVYAAAPGVVIETHDGEFDRNTAEYKQSLNANYIIINHGNGLVSRYWHLKKYSLQVSTGDTVAAGQQIAYVGSSGNSTDAHLHFRVTQNGSIVETYLDPNYWWQNHLPYSGDMAGSLDHGITDHDPTTPELRERPKTVTAFAQGPGQVACLWVQLHGISQNDRLDYYFYKPNGNGFAHYYWFPGQIRYGWWCACIDLPSAADLGNWRVDFKVNGNLWITNYFKVVPFFNQCDFNQDANVDFKDFAVFASAWKTSNGEAGWNSQCDISVQKDGIIDNLDLAVFVDNWLEVTMP
jgi:murein DD-endopeptidase MepM/ murein hydrolase activator NlpD